MTTKKLLQLWMFLVLVSLSVSAVEIGSHYETDCVESTCTTTLYSYQKYYWENGGWVQIQENFGTTNCASGYDYCVLDNLYQAHFKNAYTEPLITYGDTKLSFTLARLGNATINSPTAEVNENMITYKDVAPGVDVQYTYLPRKLKEEIILHEENIFQNNSEDLEVEFRLNTYGNALTLNNNVVRIDDTLKITDLVAYDDRKIIDIPFTLNNNFLQLTIPIDWLLNESRVFPIRIDPTVELDNSSINFNGYMNYDRMAAPKKYKRTSNPTGNLKVGYDVGGEMESCCGLPPVHDDTNSTFRTGMEWDVSSLPSDANITTLNLTVFVNKVGDNGNEDVRVWSLEQNSSFYPGENSSSPCKGNCQFFTDLGNDTNFINQTVVVNSNTIDLISAKSNLESVVNGTLEWWGFGFKAEEGDQLNWHNETRIASRDANNISKRPTLLIIMESSSESSGDTAIEQGIVNILPDAIVHDEQQIYTRSVNDTQQLGTFDKFAVNNTQRWAFNYITNGESYTNMLNITPTFHVLELIDLTAEQITQAVENFITNTLN